MTRWSLFLQTLSLLLHHFLGLYYEPLRQSTTPPQLLGRMNAVMNLLAVGLVPIGALMGGVLGEAIGLRTTLFIAVSGELSAGLWLVFSPVLSIRVLPGEDGA